MGIGEKSQILFRISFCSKTGSIQNHHTPKSSAQRRQNCAAGAHHAATSAAVVLHSRWRNLWATDHAELIVPDGHRAFEKGRAVDGNALISVARP